MLTQTVIERLQTKVDNGMFCCVLADCHRLRTVCIDLCYIEEISHTIRKPLEFRQHDIISFGDFV